MDPSTPDRTQLTRRRWGGVLLLLLALVIGRMGYTRWNAGPTHEGRSIEFWFREACRGMVRYPSEEDGRSSEARLAFIAMGTNAVPFLAREAVTLRTDPALLTMINRWRARLPRWIAGEDQFPRSRMRNVAAQLLEDIRPPASLLLPLIESNLQDPLSPTYAPAVLLLSTIGEGAETVVPFWERALERDPGTAAFSISRAGARSVPVMPAVAEHLRRHPNPVTLQQLLEWLARSGSAAAPVLPVLEPELDGTNPVLRLEVALTVVFIDPTHERARDLVSTAIAGLETATDFERSVLLEGVVQRWTGPQPALDPLLQPLVATLLRLQDALDLWNTPHAHVLRRLAPAEYRAAYEFQLEQEGLERPAAVRLLQIDPDHPSATRILAQSAFSWEDPYYMQQLGLASSTNALARDTLLYAAGRGAADLPARLGRSETSGFRHERAARAALAAQRLREVQRSRGILPPPWED